MNPISSSVPPPKTFCSPGLEKVLLKLELVLKAELDSVQRNRKNQQVLTALSERKLISIEKSLPLIAKEISVDAIDFDSAQFVTESTKPLLDKLGSETALAC